MIASPSRAVGGAVSALDSVALNVPKAGGVGLPARSITAPSATETVYTPASAASNEPPGAPTVYVTMALPTGAGETLTASTRSGAAPAPGPAIKTSDASIVSSLNPAEEVYVTLTLCVVAPRAV